MKKLSAVISVIVIFALVFTGCNTKNNKKENTTKKPEQKAQVSVAAMKGPTALGMLRLMSQNEENKTENKYTFSLAGSPDEIVPKLTKGELDMAAVPANLASTLYNKTKGELQVVAINSLGVIYIVEKGETVKTLKDLKGKNVIAAGKGTTPECALRYMLSQKNMDADKDININFTADPAEAVSNLAQGKVSIAMLPQPYVTVAQSKVKGLRIAIDLNKVWNDLDNGSSLVTGTVVARKDFIKKNPKAVEKFLKEYKESTKYATENVDKTAELSAKYGVTPNSQIAKKALPYCNITFIEGNDMKKAMQGYLKILLDQNPKVIGGKLPDDGFYFVK